MCEAIEAVSEEEAAIKWAVSYTHLDVYKRQVFSTAVRLIIWKGYGI